jgi:GTP-binding protein
MVPCDTQDIKKEYKILLKELENYNPELMDKDRILAITKCDMLDEGMIKEMKKLLPKGVKSLFISSIASKGLMELKDLIWQTLNEDSIR